MSNPAVACVALPTGVCESQEPLVCRHSTNESVNDDSNPTSPHATDDSVAALSNEAYWKMRFQEDQVRLAAAETQLAELQALLEDEQRTHQLRDMADKVRREEMEELAASRQRSAVDVDYLKNVLVGFFEKGQLPANQQVINVLALLLQFSEKDKERIRKGGPRDAATAQNLFKFGYSSK